MIDQCLTLWSKWEGFGVVLIVGSSEPHWFCNGGFVINLVLGILGFAKHRDKGVVSGLLILREIWSTLDKNPLRRFEVWTYKKINGFPQWDIIVIVDRVGHFRSLIGANPMLSLLKTT